MYIFQYEVSNKIVTKKEINENCPSYHNGPIFDARNVTDVFDACPSYLEKKSYHMVKEAFKSMDNSCYLPCSAFRIKLKANALNRPSKGIMCM